MAEASSADVAQPLELASYLTVVLTTSYTGAVPCTNLVEAVVASFSFIPELASCRLIVVCDGFQLSDRRRTKAGRLIPEDAAPYAEYIDALRTLAANAREQAAAASSNGESSAAASEDPWANAEILALPSHHGFGWAVKAAIESGLVQTKYILVVQHDRSFMSNFNLANAVRCMLSSEDQVRYLLLPTRSTTTHRETIFCRAGVRMPYLHIHGHRLLQLAFWWDSTHVASVSHYRDFVFQQKCVKRGSFPEDTLGRQMLDAVKAHGVSGAEPYHAYLWDDRADGEECRVVGHLNGAHWRAWADEGATRADEGQADGALPVQLCNSRMANFRRTMAKGGHATLEDDEVAKMEEEEEEEERVQEAPAVEDDEMGFDFSADGEMLNLEAEVDSTSSSLAPAVDQDDRENVRRCHPPPPPPPPPLISIILPIHNGEKWIDDCLEALLQQTILNPHANSTPSSTPLAHTASALTSAPLSTPPSTPRTIELSAFDDGSTDGTWSKLQQWQPRMQLAGIGVVLGRSGREMGGGCGYAKNRAVAQSTGEWLCFQDVDDLSLPDRLSSQLEMARAHGASCLVGARVRRVPEGSTPRYVAWANSMSHEQLVLHRFRECTLLMPTWFLSRAAFDRCGGFREEKCEDLLFLQEHVLRGGLLRRVDDVLVEYRYHAEAVTHSTPRKLLLTHRAAAIEKAVLSGWTHFTIWGCGRDGREFFKALSPAAKAKVVAFCDVDPAKVGTTYQCFEYRVPVLHFTEARPPFVTCVALDRTEGAFEANLASLQLVEGEDYWHFC